MVLSLIISTEVEQREEEYVEWRRESIGEERGVENATPAFDLEDRWEK